MLRSKNAIITGARTGIGLSLLRLYAKNGANCWAVIHNRTDEFIKEIEYLENEHKVWIKPIEMNLDSEDSIKTGFKEILSSKCTIDILINNAGVVSPDRLFTMTKMEDIHRVMQVNFFSPLLLAQLASRIMIRNNSGKIINISSVAAYGEDTSQLEYACSKSALSTATKKLARELGRYGISVNCVAPGLTETKMTSDISKSAMDMMRKGFPLNRIGQPEEIAKACLFLVSDLASFVNGETLKVDGGGFDLRLFNKNL